MRFPTSDSTARSSFLDFNLSRNKSLRTLEVTASSITLREESILLQHAIAQTNPAISNFLRTVLPTITSPLFSEVVVIYREVDFGGLKFWPRSTSGVYRIMTPDESAEEASRHRRQFQVFREMYAVRQDFQLILCAEVWGPVGEYTMGVLKQAIAAEVGENWLSCLCSEVIGKPAWALIVFGLSLVISLAQFAFAASGLEVLSSFIGQRESSLDFPVPSVMYSPRGMPEEGPMP